MSWILGLSGGPAWSQNNDFQNRLTFQNTLKTLDLKVLQRSYAFQNYPMSKGHLPKTSATVSTYKKLKRRLDLNISLEFSLLKISLHSSSPVPRLLCNFFEFDNVVPHLGLPPQNCVLLHSSNVTTRHFLVLELLRGWNLPRSNFPITGQRGSHQNMVYCLICIPDPCALNPFQFGSVSPFFVLQRGKSQERYNFLNDKTL